MKIIFFIKSILIISLLHIQGCATIVSGTTQEVSFQSSPDEATVKVDGKPIGKTPLTVQLDKEKGQTLAFEKDGYKTVTMRLSTSLEPWFWGNIVTGGLLGSTTDGVSGAVNKYSPDQYFVTLTPIEDQDDVLSQIEEVKRYIVVNFEELHQVAVTNSYKDNDVFLSLVELLEVDSANNDEVNRIIGILKEEVEPIKVAKIVAQEFVD